tara:strand:- start:328 stop:1146 length:819 start_codon:yes stop_codon:yes gene_type:complete
MNRKDIINQIKKKRSFLCIGLDVDVNKIPSHLLDLEDPVFEFNRQIIDSTKDLCVAYKPNLAFYEAMGIHGMNSLKRTLEYIPKDIFKIADAKRGDIGNTSNMYADAFFKQMNFDGLTVSPYMGSDSVLPFLDSKGKWVILLALTSNQGSLEFQTMKLDNGQYLYEKILTTSSQWGTDHNTMFVVGATRAEKLLEIRKIIPNHFLLVPGVGAQGGSLKDVANNAMNADCGILVNSSRGIIYAGNGQDFAQESRKKAQSIQIEMDKLLLDKSI